jgi:hypothetical protein
MSYPEFRKDIFKLLDNIDHGSGRISYFVGNLKEFCQSNNFMQSIDCRIEVESKRGAGSTFTAILPDKDSET